jgi:hypothetical protein
MAGFCGNSVVSGETRPGDLGDRKPSVTIKTDKTPEEKQIKYS